MKVHRLRHTLTDTFSTGQYFLGFLFQNSPVTPAQVIANKGSVRARGYCRLRLPPAGGSLSLLIEGKKTRWVLNSLELCLHTSEPGGSHEPTSNATQDAQAPPRYSECGLSGGLFATPFPQNH